MKVKGSAVETLPLFIKEKFGEEGFQKWLEVLSPEAQETFRNRILATSWFPLKEILSEPTKKLCETLYGGDLKGAWECGRYSADYALKGVYKMFIKLGSVHFLIKKASTILPTYFDPSNIDIIEQEKNNAVLHITKFEDSDETIERRIAGWIERALEISGCKNIKVTIQKSLAKGDSVTEINLVWS